MWHFPNTVVINVTASLASLIILLYCSKINECIKAFLQSSLIRSDIDLIFLQQYVPHGLHILKHRYNFYSILYSVLKSYWPRKSIITNCVRRDTNPSCLCKQFKSKCKQNSILDTISVVWSFDIISAMGKAGFTTLCIW